MKKRLLALAVVGVAALVAGIAFAFAATDNGGGSAQSGAATVRVKQIPGHGNVLVDAKGHALYRSDQERRGMVLCAGACLAFWQPLKVTGAPTRSSSTVGKLGIVKRPDGGRQVTDNGRLLYAFKLDKPGSVKGDGFKDAFGDQKFTWHVVRPVGASSSSGTTTTMPTPTYSYP